MKGNLDLKSSALFNKSQKLQDKKSTSDRVDKMSAEDEALEKYNELELEYEQNLVSTDRIYLVRVFPIFILSIGLFLILIYVFLNFDTIMPFYIGLFVALSGIIWKLIMMQVEKKRKEKFLFGK
jgi:hypothetical protein